MFLLLRYWLFNAPFGEILYAMLEVLAAPQKVGAPTRPTCASAQATIFREGGKLDTSHL